MLIQLGDFQFRISTMAYDKLVRSMTWRWNVLDIIGDHQQLQFSGYGDDVITLSGTTYPTYNTLQPFDDLTAEANKGQPLIMVAADGTFLGRFVIESFTFDESQFHKSGVPHIAAFSIGIRRYRNL